MNIIIIIIIIIIIYLNMSNGFYFMVNMTAAEFISNRIGKC